MSHFPESAFNRLTATEPVGYPVLSEGLGAVAEAQPLLERLQTDVLWHERRCNETIAADLREAILTIENLRLVVGNTAVLMEQLCETNLAAAKHYKCKFVLGQCREVLSA